LDFKAGAVEMFDELQETRHTLHQWPEIGLDLPRTQELVVAQLSDHVDEVVLGSGLSSVVGVLRGGRRALAGEPRTVLLRADMDALPVHEQLEVPYRSRVAGAMHGCGHDLHTAMLLGAAKLLSQHREALHGDVVFMFQPGEEGFDGARLMLDEGALTASGALPVAAYALHVFSALAPRGQFFSRPGTFMAASDALKASVRGVGGHGYMPHLTRDVNSVVAAMVTGLESLVAREFDVFDPVVLTIGKMHGGHDAAVIPAESAFEATIRSFSVPAQQRLKDRVQRLLRGMATARDVELVMEYVEEYPVTVNHDGPVELATARVRGMYGDRAYAEMKQPLTGAEDFSRVLQVVPGAMLGLGAVTGSGCEDSAPFNHSPLAEFSDDVLPMGAAIYADLAAEVLKGATTT
jgi:hippurate hydrolase